MTPTLGACGQDFLADAPPWLLRTLIGVSALLGLGVIGFVWRLLS